MVGLFCYFWFGRFDLAGLVFWVWYNVLCLVCLFGKFGLVTSIWQVLFGMFGVAGLFWQVLFGMFDLVGLVL